MLNFSPRLRDALTRGFWIEEEMLTSRSCGTRSRAQRPQRSERGEGQAWGREDDFVC